MVFGLFVAAPAVAAEGMSTVLVLPAEGEGRALGDAADAVQLRFQGVLRAAGGTNVVHTKMYLRVMERYARRLTDLDGDRRIQTLGEILGADVVVATTVRVAAPNTVLDIRAIPVIYKDLSGSETRGQASAGSLLKALDQSPTTLLTLLKGTGRVPDLSTPEPEAIGPRTSSEPALLAYSACNIALMAQPLGLRNPVVIDDVVLSQSEELCREALAKDRTMEQAHAELALIHALRGEQEKAEAALKKAKKSRAFSTSYWLAKFWVLSRYYDVDLALTSLRKAIETNPGFMLGRGYLGEALIALKRPADAETVFREYLTAAPRQSWVMGQIGYALAKQKQYDEAIEWTEKGLRMAPGDPELLLQLASRFIDAGRYAEASTLLKRVVSQGGARGEVHLRLGYAYLKLGKFNEAEQEMIQAINKADSSSEWRTRGRARYNLAVLWLESDAPENALRQLRMAVQEGFRDKGALQARAMAPLRTKKQFQALMKAPPKTGIAPQFVSPLGTTSESGELIIDESKGKKKKNPKVLEQF